MTGARRLEVDRISAGGLPLVIFASALWGSDALFRRGLALELPATTVVVYEHLILAVLMLPFLFRIPWSRLSLRDLGSLVLIGAGASALATGLFTASFRYGDPNTVLLLQKLQPVIAVIGAHVVLGERVTRRYAGYFLAAAAGAWLITFPDPLAVTASTAAAGALAAGAAALWAMGTVLGRRMSDRLTFTELTAARFGIGLPAALLFAVVGPGRAETLAISRGDVLPLVLLALIPGLAALLLYYRGLRRTPASAATLGELGFPVSALLVNYLAFGAVLTATQAVGTIFLVATLMVMAVTGRRRATNLGVRIERRPDGAQGAQRSRSGGGKDDHVDG